MLLRQPRILMRFFLWALPLPQNLFFIPNASCDPCTCLLFIHFVMICIFCLFLIYNSPTHLFIHFWGKPDLPYPQTIPPTPTGPLTQGSPCAPVCPARPARRSPARSGPAGFSWCSTPLPSPTSCTFLDQTLLAPSGPAPTLPEGERLLYCRGRSGN